jgi:hypothetical protein
LTPDEAAVRAERAKQLLEDPLLQETFKAAQDALIAAVELAKTESEFYKAGLALQVFRLIKDSISSHIATAQIMQFNFKDRTSFLDRISGK